MNKIDAIVVHCSATRAGQDIGKKEITQMHLQRGFSTIGYNYVVRLDGRSWQLAHHRRGTLQQ